MGSVDILFDTFAFLNILATFMKSKTLVTDGSDKFLNGLRNYAVMIANCPTADRISRERARWWLNFLSIFTK